MTPVTLSLLEKVKANRSINTIQFKESIASTYAPPRDTSLLSVWVTLREFCGKHFFSS